MLHEKIKIWSDEENVFLHTYISDLAPMSKSDTLLPAIIICPGGGYLSCSMDNEGEPIARSFANAGYQTFVLEYSVAETSNGKDITFPKQMLELGKAMLIVKEHAREWHINPDWISICGFSAGANLCGIYATRWQDNILSDYFEKDATEFKPFAALLGYGLLDYEYQLNKEVKLNPNSKDFMETSACVYMGSPTPTKEKLQEVSPICHVSKNTPPIFMFHSANDALVYVNNSLRFANELSNKNVPFELHVFQAGNHGFGTGLRFGASFYERDAYLRSNDWLSLSQEWLYRLIKPELQDADPMTPGFFEKYDVKQPDFIKEAMADPGKN